MYPATQMKMRLRSDLREAMRHGRATEVQLLREVISAIDNAEAPPQRGASLASDQYRFESGMAEIARLALDGDSVRALLICEIEEREQAAAEMERLGQTEHATRLRDQARLARRYLE